MKPRTRWSALACLAPALACGGNSEVHTGADAALDAAVPVDDGTWYATAIDSTDARDAGSADRRDASSGWLSPRDGGAADADSPRGLWGSTLLVDVRNYYASDDGACYVRGDGSVWCKGDNADGQLGNGTFGGVNGAPLSTNTFAKVLGVTGVVDMVISPRGRCALSADGGLACWGAFDAFRVGTPANVKGLSGRTAQIAGVSDSFGEWFLFAMSDAGALQAIDFWADDPTSAPEAQSVFQGPSSATTWAVDPGTGWYIVDSAGSLVRMRADITRGEGPSGTHTDTFPLTGVSQVRVVSEAAVAGGSGIAVLRDGGVACWGLCPLGDPAGLSRVAWDSAVRIPGLEHVRDALSVGCVVDDADDVWCWGNEMFNATAGLFTVPVQVGNLPDVRALYVLGFAEKPTHGLTRQGELRELDWP